jgi:malonyl-CoA O-methyltransferase
MQAEKDSWSLDRNRVRQSFERAARTYDNSAVLSREVGQRMAERLDLVTLKPGAFLDAGCGTGDGLSELSSRYPDAVPVGLDFAYAMARHVCHRTSTQRSLISRVLRSFAGGPSARVICGDLRALPFKPASFELAWSNLVFHWIDALPAVLNELSRVLQVDGLLTFTTLGPDTLLELRQAFAAVDGDTHVNRFVDMHDIGDALVAAGFADPVVDMERLTLTYADGASMMRDLKSAGAHNATAGRPRGLMGKARWRRMLAELERFRDPEGRLPASFEVIYGHAWKVAPRKTRDGRAIVRFDLPGRR